jgi:hypothetical protein
VYKCHTIPQSEAMDAGQHWAMEVAGKVMQKMQGGQ